MVLKNSKKFLSMFVSLAMFITIAASIPFSAKADTIPAQGIKVTYSTQVQTYGWQKAVSDGALAGTVGQAKRLEAIKISLSGTNLPQGATITYKTQVQTYGWQNAVKMVHWREQ